MRWRCDHIAVTYQSEDGSLVPALIDASIDVVSGECVAIIGPNGSGKSTLALCLAGLIQPTQGHIIVDGGSPEPPHGAIVFQSPEDNLIGATVLEEMMLTLEHTSPNAADESAARAELTRLGLGHLTGRSTDNLSGGEKQKVAVACALASGRQLAVLDEPTSHLDPPGRREFFEFLRATAEANDGRDSGTGGSTPLVLGGRAASRGFAPALVLVTQYEAEARRLPRVIALDAGRIIYDGPSAGWSTAARDGQPGFSIPTSAPDARITARASDLRQCDSPLWPMPAHPLDRITLEVRAGEAIGLCGPIGAGKTTLALHLAGLFERWEGDLSWPGMPSWERPVMLIQFPERQLFCATVLEDVKVGPKARGVAPKAIADVARAALDRVGLPPAVFGSRSPFDLSGGQKRRAALAGVAAVPSGLYLLDEPQAALDGDGLQRLDSLLQEWVSQGSAYVIISHDLDFLRRLTHRVWVMDKGRLIFDGPWDTLDSQPEVLKSIGFTAAAGCPTATLPDPMTEGPPQFPP